MKYLAVSLCLFTTLGLFAQDRVGVKGGVNFASEKASSNGVSISSETITLPHGGLYFVSHLSEQIDIQYEVLYSVEGGKGANIEDKISYLNLPLLVRFNAGSVLNFHMGPQIGFKIIGKSDGQDITDFLKETNLSGIFGLAVESKGGLSLGIRYALGLTDVSKQNLGADFKLNTIQLWTGIRFYNR